MPPELSRKTRDNDAGPFVWLSYLSFIDRAMAVGVRKKNPPALPKGRKEREAIPRTGRVDVMMRTTATATATIDGGR